MPVFNLHQSGLRAILAGALLALATSVSAATGGFVATLSAAQQSATGLPALSLAERNTLDQLIAQELALVRQDTPVELTGTFFSRRSAAERQSAGLDRLSSGELAKLNELIAAVLAIHPKPKERPRLKDDDVISATRKPEIHGAVTLAYGWGGGGTFRGASLWLDYFDPASGLGLGVGLSNFSGPGFYDYYPDYSGYGSRYHSPIPLYHDASFRSLGRDDFGYGDGRSFRALSSWDASGHGRRR